MLGHNMTIAFCVNTSNSAAIGQFQTVGMLSFCVHPRKFVDYTLRHIALCAFLFSFRG